MRLLGLNEDLDVISAKMKLLGIFKYPLTEDMWLTSPLTVGFKCYRFGYTEERSLPFKTIEDILVSGNKLGGTITYTTNSFGVSVFILHNNDLVLNIFMVVDGSVVDFGDSLLVTVTSGKEYKQFYLDKKKYFD